MERSTVRHLHGDTPATFDCVPDPDIERRCRRSLTAKYAMDRLLAALLVLLLSPLFLAAILALLVERLFDRDAAGPLFWSEIRISDGRPFRLFKFRTLKRSVLEQIGVGETSWHYQRDFANHTRAGHLLTLYYVDELPQLFSILMGHMSFVGPRPKPPREYEIELARGQVALRYLRGGMTGPHQLTKGRAGQFRFKSEEYLNRCQEAGPFDLVWGDLVMLSKTLGLVRRGEGL